MFQGKNILLGVTGGIAAYKAAAVASAFRKEGANVQVVMTKNALEFITPLTFETLTNNPVITDTFRHESAWDVAHVSLAKKTDLAVIAPATANIIAKMAAGLADDMLSTTYLALRCPVFVAPAMNTAMFENRVVQQNIEKIKLQGCHIIEPGMGFLACGDTGTGRMAEPEQIIETIKNFLAQKQDFKGIPMMITAGPTVEPIDPVRYLSNRSSGKMGYALAKAARDRGADVTLISGPISLKPPEGVNVMKVQSAGDMYDAVMQSKNTAKIIIKCAAVADYTPVTVSVNKIKKENEMTLRLEATKDILRELGANKSYYLVGFAAETQNVIGYAKKKLAEKNLDMIVANDVSGEETGFNSDKNKVVIITKSGKELHLDSDFKEIIANRILDEIIEEYV